MGMVDLLHLLHALGPPDALLLLAGVMVVGALAGEIIARRTRLPRLVGYTLAGWCAVALGAGLTMPLGNTARLVIDLSLALLLFEIGSRVRLRWLRRNPGLLATSVLESVVAGAAVFWALLVLLEQPVAAACAALAVPASAAVAGRVALTRRLTR